MIRAAIARGKRVLFLAHRLELIDQCSERLSDIGVEHGVVMGSDPRYRPWLPVQVCSVPTLVRREKLPPADLIFIDEAHRAAAESYLKIMRRYEKAVFVGLTATPARLDGKGLGTLFQSMVECPSVAELTEMGYLVPSRVFGHPMQPDLTDVHKTAGDYKKDELATAVDKPKLIGSILEHWLKLARDRQTVCFAVNIHHSQEIMNQFRAAGIACEHLDSDTDRKERKAILRRFKSGETKVVTNVQILTEGYDNPATSCAILARPTLSLTLYLQMVGRVLRPFGQKSDAIILDHAGSVMQFGLPDDDRQWSLDGSRNGRGRDAYDASLAVRMCPECWCAFKATEITCPACGWMYVAKDREIKVEAGELQEITESPEAKPYVPKHWSDNPIRRHFQHEAVKLNKSHRWMFKMSELAERGDLYVPRDIFLQWQAWERRKAGVIHIPESRAIEVAV